MDCYKNLSLDDILDEKWVAIANYSKYEISSMGRVKSLFYARTNKTKILKQQLIIGGYLRVELNKRGNRHFVHRLVGLAFIPNPENKPFINHKDGNPLNNTVSNLEWATNSENIIHSHEILGKPYGVPPVLKGAKNGTARKVYQVHLTSGEIINSFDTILEAERTTGICNSNISSAARGRYKTAGGFKWKYA